MSTSPHELQGGRYVLLHKLGEGSQGATYEALEQDGGARDHKTVALADEWARYVRRARTGAAPARGRVVAIKYFRTGEAKAWKDVELAEREVRTLKALEHPKLPRYIEHFEEGGALYLVMEKIEGESLASLFAQRRGFAVADVVRMLEDVGSALRYLHERAPSIVHRDVKPGNVIRRPDGSFALVDFGAVRDRLRPTGGSTVVGTFGYMAPEQFQGRAAPASDVYGLAATALAMLTGREPEELPHAGLGIDVRRALPGRTEGPLVDVLAAMLVPDPDRRAASIDEALARLGSRGTRPDASERGDAGDLRETHRSTRTTGRRARKRERLELERKARIAKAKKWRARRREVPWLPRLVARVGLLVAIVAVTVVVGALVPAALYALSLAFGDAPRRAARACVGASRRSTAAMGRASAWLSGRRAEDEGSPAPVRVAADVDRVRVSETARERTWPASDAEEADFDPLDVAEPGRRGSAPDPGATGRRR